MVFGGDSFQAEPTEGGEGTLEKPVAVFQGSQTNGV